VQRLQQQLLSQHARLHETENKSSSSSNAAPASPDSSSSSTDAPGSSQIDADKLQSVLVEVCCQLPVSYDDDLQLQQAAAWPRDLLAPAAVQRQGPEQSRTAAVGAKLVVEKYLQHQATVLHIEDEQQQQQGPAVAAAAAAAAYGVPGQLTDVAELALQPPLPLDAFVAPSLWWERQQELLALDRSCDNCSKQFEADQVRTKQLSSFTIVMPIQVMLKGGCKLVC
jgi:hypothetical protein